MDKRIKTGDQSGLFSTLDLVLPEDVTEEELTIELTFPAEPHTRLRTIKRITCGDEDGIERVFSEALRLHEAMVALRAHGISSFAYRDGETWVPFELFESE